MGQKNSFKELEEEHIRIMGMPPDYVLRNVKRNIRFVQLFGDILDLYFPKAIQTMAQLAEGSDETTSGEDPITYKTNDH